MEPAACYGYRVESPLAFAYLREGAGESLEVAVADGGPLPDHARLLAEWLPRRGHRYHTRLYEDGPRYRMWVEGLGWYQIDPEARRINVPESDDVVRREEGMWSIPSALCFLARGDLSLHAAAIQVDEGAILLAAPGRFGKTTLAAGFVQAGYRLLSEDITCIRLSPEPCVIPGPAMLRVRRDVLRHLTLSRMHIVRERPDRVSFAIDEPWRGDCRPVRLRAVVLLKGEARRPATEAVATVRALPDLWTLSFRLPDSAAHARSFAGVAEIVRRVAVWNLLRPFRVEELPSTVDHVVAACLGPDRPVGTA
jgi:hypothetical protein